MSEHSVGDRVHLTAPGHMTDQGNAVREGEPGTVVGFRGVSGVVVSWRGSSDRETSCVAAADLYWEHPHANRR